MTMTKKNRVKHVIACILLCVVCSIIFSPMQASAKGKTQLSQKKIVLVKGVKYTDLYLKNAPAKVTWKSSKKSVASVSKTGIVTPKKRGTCKITATCKGKKYVCSVRVITASLNTKSLSLSVGQQATLVPRCAYSADRKYAKTTYTVTSNQMTPPVSITKDGLVTAKAAGNCNITVTVGDSTFLVKASVSKSNGSTPNKPAPTNAPAGKVTITPDKQTIDLAKGGTGKITVAGAKSYSFTENSAHFNIASNGTITATSVSTTEEALQAASYESVTVSFVDAAGNKGSYTCKVLVIDSGIEAATAEMEIYAKKVLDEHPYGSGRLDTVKAIRDPATTAYVKAVNNKFESTAEINALRSQIEDAISKKYVFKRQVVYFKDESEKMLGYFNELRSQYKLLPPQWIDTPNGPQMVGKFVKVSDPSESNLKPLKWDDGYGLIHAKMQSAYNVLRAADVGYADKSQSHVCHSRSAIAADTAVRCTLRAPEDLTNGYIASKAEGVAAACSMRLWQNSPGHKTNILSAREYMSCAIMGVVMPDGDIFCVTIASLDGNVFGLDTYGYKEEWKDHYDIFLWNDGGAAYPFTKEIEQAVLNAVVIR